MFAEIQKQISKRIKPQTQATIYLKTFGLTKVPLLFYLNPRVTVITEEKVSVRIPLTWRSKNHLGSMYFGALAAGADCAGGLLAMKLITDHGNKVALVFKDFHANFLKRAEGDVDFKCEQGIEIKKLVEKTMKSGERENLSVHVNAFVGAEVVATFVLTLSLKRKA